MSASAPHEVAGAVVPARRPVVAWRRAGTDGLLASIWLLFAIANFKEWLAGNPAGAGTMAAELTIVIAFVARRKPWVTSRAPLAFVATGIGSFGALALRPAYAPLFDLGPLYLGLQLAGALCAVVSLVYLGRSFGLVAANRGVRTEGPYRLMRHPLYASYFLAYAAYTFENPSVQNAVVLLVVLSFQIVRIRTEEALLSDDAVYLRYCKRVRYRLIPRVW
jgi:protein-S-isoprenylcysteine O-methyltransferase Ste14